MNFRFVRNLLLAVACCLLPFVCFAQVTNIVPQSNSSQVFNGVSTAQTSGCLTTQGENTYFLFYLSGGSIGAPTGVQIRLEGSFNSDGATCSTGTWFAISDDGTEPAQNGNNLVLADAPGIPFVRANLVACTGCDANDTISAWFGNTSALGITPFGAYGAGQQLRKVLFEGQAGGVNKNSGTIITPFGSTAGFIVVTASTGNFTGGTISARCVDSSAGGTIPTTFNFPSGAITATVPITHLPCVAVFVRVACGACSATYKAFYYFYPPASVYPPSIQPPNTNNSEATATNATASVTLTPVAGQRATVYHISGRCGAGTAQLLVVDTTTSTNLWSSGTAEVGTTTFSPPAWNPGLAGASGDTVQVQLTACGVGNVGTVDVQATVGP